MLILSSQITDTKTESNHQSSTSLKSDGNYYNVPYRATEIEEEYEVPVKHTLASTDNQDSTETQLNDPYATLQTPSLATPSRQYTLIIKGESKGRFNVSKPYVKIETHTLYIIWSNDQLKVSFQTILSCFNHLCIQGLHNC